jgi:hypothetical protein
MLTGAAAAFAAAYGYTAAAASSLTCCKASKSKQCEYNNNILQFQLS